MMKLFRAAVLGLCAAFLLSSVPAEAEAAKIKFTIVKADRMPLPGIDLDGCISEDEGLSGTGTGTFTMDTLTGLVEINLTGKVVNASGRTVKFTDPSEILGGGTPISYNRFLYQVTGRGNFTLRGSFYLYGSMLGGGGFPLFPIGFPGLGDPV